MLFFLFSITKEQIQNEILNKAKRVEIPIDLYDEWLRITIPSLLLDQMQNEDILRENRIKQNGEQLILDYLVEINEIFELIVNEVNNKLSTCELTNESSILSEIKDEKLLEICKNITNLEVLQNILIINLVKEKIMQDLTFPKFLFFSMVYIENNNSKIDLSIIQKDCLSKLSYYVLGIISKNDFLNIIKTKLASNKRMNKLDYEYFIDFCNDIQRNLTPVKKKIHLTNNNSNNNSFFGKIILNLILAILFIRLVEFIYKRFQNQFDIFLNKIKSYIQPILSHKIFQRIRKILKLENSPTQEVKQKKNKQIDNKIPLIFRKQLTKKAKHIKKHIKKL